LTLADGSDQVVDKTPALVDRSDSSLTWQRLPDGGSAWKLVEGTKAAANDPRTFKSASAVQSPSSSSSSSTTTSNAGQCIGSAQCLEGKVVRVTDADTLTVLVGSDKYIVDLSLTKAGKGDRSFTQNLCFGTEKVVVDQDDKQPGRGKNNIMGVVYCGSTNLNQQLLDGGQASLDPRQCARSEFASQDWAKRHGCQ
jgi:endonuclease YncB( thermonuclease family)